MKYITTVNGEEYEIDINREGEIRVNGELREVDFTAGTHAIYSALINNKSYEAVVEERNNKYNVLIGGDLYEVDVTDERSRRLAEAAGLLGGDDNAVISPMPGSVVAVPVEVGQAVKQGETVVILESMKMENELKAPIDGVVESVSVQAGQSVDGNVVLVTIAPPEE